MRCCASCRSGIARYSSRCIPYSSIVLISITILLILFSGAQLSYAEDNSEVPFIDVSRFIELYSLLNRFYSSAPTPSLTIPSMSCNSLSLGDLVGILGSSGPVEKNYVYSMSRIDSVIIGENDATITFRGGLSYSPITDYISNLDPYLAMLEPVKQHNSIEIYDDIYYVYKPDSKTIIPIIQRTWTYGSGLVTLAFSYPLLSQPVIGDNKIVVDVPSECKRFSQGVLKQLTKGYTKIRLEVNVNINAYTLNGSTKTMNHTIVYDGFARVFSFIRLEEAGPGRALYKLYVVLVGSIKLSSASILYVGEDLQHLDGFISSIKVSIDKYNYSLETSYYVPGYSLAVSLSSLEASYSGLYIRDETLPNGIIVYGTRDVEVYAHVITDIDVTGSIRPVFTLRTRNSTIVYQGETLSFTSSDIVSWNIPLHGENITWIKAIFYITTIDPNGLVSYTSILSSSIPLNGTNKAFNVRVEISNNTLIIKGVSYLGSPITVTAHLLDSNGTVLLEVSRSFISTISYTLNVSDIASRVSNIIVELSGEGIHYTSGTVPIVVASRFSSQLSFTVTEELSYMYLAFALGIPLMLWFVRAFSVIIASMGRQNTFLSRLVSIIESYTLSSVNILLRAYIAPLVLVSVLAFVFTSVVRIDLLRVIFTSIPVQYLVFYPGLVIIDIIRNMLGATLFSVKPLIVNAMSRTLMFLGGAAGILVGVGAARGLAKLVSGFRVFSRFTFLVPIVSQFSVFITNFVSMILQSIFMLFIFTVTLYVGLEVLMVIVEYVMVPLLVFYVIAGLLLMLVPSTSDIGIELTSRSTSLTILVVISTMIAFLLANNMPAIMENLRAIFASIPLSFIIMPIIDLMLQTIVLLLISFIVVSSVANVVINLFPVLGQLRNILRI